MVEEEDNNKLLLVKNLHHKIMVHQVVAVVEELDSLLEELEYALMVLSVAVLMEVMDSQEVYLDRQQVV